MPFPQIGHGNGLADGAVQFEFNAQVQKPVHFGCEHVLRQSILGDPIVQHPSGLFLLLVDRDPVASSRHLIGEGEPCGPCADYPDSHP